MNLISIGSDRNLFQDGSGVVRRALFYSSVTEETHIIIFSLRSLELREKKLSDKVFLYPTNSRSRLLYIFDAYRIAKRIVVGCKLSVVGYCIVSTQDPFEAGLVGWLLKKKFGLPLQMQIHTDFLNPYFAKESFLNRIRVFLAKFLLPRADCIRVVSERIRRSLKAKSYKTKVNVLPALIDFKKIAEQPIQTDLRKKYPNRFIILMASRLTKEKNIASAIEAMREIVKQFPNAFLLIIGDGFERRRLMSHVSSFMLQDNVKFESWTDDLASYYKTADLFLVSSLYEGYGRTILEAMACGLSVISTKVGIADEVIRDGENGFLIASPDAASIAETVCKAVAAHNMPAMREKARTLSSCWLIPPQEYLHKLKEALMSCSQ